MRESDKAVTAELGRRIRRSRHAAGLTQAALARKAGLHPGTISGIELGHREMQMKTAVLICRALKVDPDKIFGGIEWMTEPDAPGRGSWRITRRPCPSDRTVRRVRPADGEV